MKGASSGENLGSLRNQSPKEAPDTMLHVGLDLSRNRLDLHVLDDAGDTVEVTAAPPERDGLEARTKLHCRRR